MLTFHHAFSSRIFLDAADHSIARQRVMLGRTKDSRLGILPATTTWILRSAQDDARRKSLVDQATKGGSRAR